MAIRLGSAGLVRHRDDPADDYVVMTGPEGNEFCGCPAAHP